MQNVAKLAQYFSVVYLSTFKIFECRPMSYTYFETPKSIYPKCYFSQVQNFPLPSNPHIKAVYYTVVLKFYLEKKLSSESSRVKFKNGIQSTRSSFHCFVSSEFRVLVEYFRRSIVILMHLQKMLCPSK